MVKNGISAVEIYTHVGRRDSGNIKSPLDVMLYKEANDDD